MNMKITSVIRCRNLFIISATFCVLCLAPLADIHLEGSSKTKSYTHGQKHNETMFAMFLHEVLFNQLQHTLDNVIPGISCPSVKINTSLAFKKKAFSYPQVVCNTNSQIITVHLLKREAHLYDHKRVVETFPQEYSGLSPPLV